MSQIFRTQKIHYCFYKIPKLVHILKNTNRVGAVLIVFKIYFNIMFPSTPSPSACHSPCGFAAKALIHFSSGSECHALHTSHPYWNLVRSINHDASYCAVFVLLRPYIFFTVLFMNTLNLYPFLGMKDLLVFSGEELLTNMRIKVLTTVNI